MTRAERLAEARELRDAWKAASLAVAQGQSYTIGARSLTRADAALITSQFEKWSSRVRRLESGRRGRARRVIVRDL